MIIVLLVIANIVIFLSSYFKLLSEYLNQDLIVGLLDSLRVCFWFFNLYNQNLLLL